MDPAAGIEIRLCERLLSASRTLATAESCSGGLVAHLLTNVPGASGFFLGGVVAYSNAIKERVLGVPHDMLEAEGAVSEPVALHMALGVRERFGADLGLGVTGIAGPGGGTAEKPVGLVYIAVADDGGACVGRHLFSGTRIAIKQQTAAKALSMIWERIG